MSTNRTASLDAVLITLSAGILYFCTAARNIVVGDSPELITAAATLGVAHPPGYPLFTMLGHLFSLLPFGPIPFRLSLFSVACDSLAVGVVYLTAFRLTQCRLCAATASLLLAVNSVFWSWSLTAEVFPLNNLLASLVIYFLIRWYQQPERWNSLMAASLTAGLGLTNHLTLVLLAPAFCFVLWQRRHFLRPPLVGLCTAIFCAALSPYLYIPWASAHHPLYNWGGVSSLQDMFALMSRSDYGTGSLIGDPSYQGGSSLKRLTVLCWSFGWVMGPLVVVGAVQAYRSERWYLIFSAIAFVFTGPFFVLISNVNLDAAPRALSVLERFFLLPNVVLAPLLAFGVLLTMKAVTQYLPAFSGWLPRLLAVVVAGGLVILVALKYQAMDQSRNTMARHFAEDALSSTEPGSILLVAGDALAFPLIYLQTVEHFREEIPLIGTRLLSAPWYLRELRERYPDVVIPFDEYDPERHNLKMLLDANAQRTIFAMGPVTGDDHSLDKTYLTYPHGLLMILAPRSKVFSFENVMTENSELLDRYRVPTFTTVRSNTLEADILTAYSWLPFRIGDAYERRGNQPEARNWYKRALAIDPFLSQAKNGLARVGQ